MRRWRRRRRRRRRSSSSRRTSRRKRRNRRRALGTKQGSAQSPSPNQSPISAARI
jgi:hypothetical protein